MSGVGAMGVASTHALVFAGDDQFGGATPTPRKPDARFPQPPTATEEYNAIRGSR